MKKNLCLILAGLVFFAFPNYNLLDIMPDFIGALLIMAGLSKMYVFDGNLEDARRGAKFLLWISLLRLALCFWCMSGGRRDYLLPFTFIICVLEAIYMISLFKGLYLGLEYTLMRAGSERLVKKTSEAFTMSFIFVIASRILEFAPQICEIYAQDAELDLSAGASFKMSMAQMKMYVLGACLVCGIILGVIYLFVIFDAWIRVIADKSYAPFIEKKYEDYLISDREKYVSSKIGLIYFLFTLSFVFFFDIYIDGINIVPSFIGIILLGFSGMIASRLAGIRRVCCVVLCAAACLSSCLCYNYMNRVHLGINSLYSLESYNYREFPLLADKSSVTISAVLSLSELVLVSALLILDISIIKKLFAKERRTVAIPMLSFLQIPAILTLVLASALKILKTLEGHLATNETVLGYVKSKARISSQSEYLKYMQITEIAEYERISSVSYALSLVTVILALICVLYLFRIRRFTDGDGTRE